LTSHESPARPMTLNRVTETYIRLQIFPPTLRADGKTVSFIFEVDIELQRIDIECFAAVDIR
jgi:hypothetical protein